jgi:GNAT superfamily N-acetyltransferase
VQEQEVTVRPVQDGDRPTVEWLTTQLWGAPEVIVHDGVFHPATLPGFIAERAGRIAGLATFDVRPGVLEIVTINALDLYAGIGTMLIEAVRAEAKRRGCREITLTTTNDNIGALRFYQRRGFRLAALRPGAVDRSRLHKPEIPSIGDFGIPLRDEIDLTCPVLRNEFKSVSRTYGADSAGVMETPGIGPAAIIGGARSPRAGGFCGASSPGLTEHFTHRVWLCAVAIPPDALYRDYDCPREHDAANR